MLKRHFSVMDPVAVSPVLVKVALENICNMLIEQLKYELTNLGQDVKGWLKPAVQKCFTKMLFDKSSVDPITKLQLRLKQMELNDK